MIKNEWTEASVASALARFAARIKTLQHDAGAGEQLTPKSALKLFVERSGLLRQPAKGSLDFAHRSFQEYMAAQAAVNEGDFGLLRKNAAHSHWREVIILAAGLARLGERNSMIESLLTAADDDANNRSRLLLVAAACINTAVEIDPQVKKRAQGRLSELVPPRTVSDAAMLVQAAGEMAVPFLKRPRWINAKQATACVRGLAMIGSLEAIDAIAEYAEHDKSSWAVQKEIIRSADRIDHGLFLSIIAPHIDVGRLPGDAVANAFRIFGPGVFKGLQDAPELKLDAKYSDLSILNHFPQVESIELVGSAYSDISALRIARKLRSVRITKTSVRDLSPLRGLPSLSELHLTSHGLDLARIANIETITSLKIWDFPLANLSVISSVRNLTDLQFWGVTIDLTDLKGLTRLQNLEFIHCKGLDIFSLPELPALRNIRFYECGLAEDDIFRLEDRRPGVRISTKLVQ